MCGLVFSFAVTAVAAEKSMVVPKNAAPMVGPYSYGVEANGFIYTSGQLPFNPATKSMPEGIKAQTKQAMENVKTVVEAAGSNMGKIVKINIFVQDLNHFDDMNEVYATFFAKDYPARTCVQVARIPRDALIEIEAIAIK